MKDAISAMINETEEFIKSYKNAVDNPPEELKEYLNKIGSSMDINLSDIGIENIGDISSKLYEHLLNLGYIVSPTYSSNFCNERYVLSFNIRMIDQVLKLDEMKSAIKDMLNETKTL